MQSLLGTNNGLPLFHIANIFICLEETNERINEFYIVYMINTKLNINRKFREKVNIYMITTFGEIKQPHVITTSEKNNTGVLALLLFYETSQNLNKYFRVLSRVTYTIISNYVCIDY